MGSPGSTRSDNISMSSGNPDRDFGNPGKDSENRNSETIAKVLVDLEVL